MQERLSLPKYSGKTTTLLIQCNSLTNVYIHLKIPLIALGYSLGVSVDLYIIRGGREGAYDRNFIPTTQTIQMETAFKSR